MAATAHPIRKRARRSGLEARVDALEQLVADLAAQLAKEVRTQRLVVVGPDGVERVVTNAGDGFGELKVLCKSPADTEFQDTYVGLAATDEHGAADVYLFGGGNGFAHLGLHQLDEADHRVMRGSSVEAQFHASLWLQQPNNNCGIVADYEGIKNAPMRLADEARAADKRGVIAL